MFKVNKLRNDDFFLDFKNVPRTPAGQKTNGFLTRDRTDSSKKYISFIMSLGWPLAWAAFTPQNRLSKLIVMFWISKHI